MSLLFSQVTDLRPKTLQKLNSFICIFERSCPKVRFDLLCVVRFMKHLFSRALLLAAIMAATATSVCFFVINLFIDSHWGFKRIFIRKVGEGGWSQPSPLTYVTLDEENMYKSVYLRRSMRSMRIMWTQ